MNIREQIAAIRKWVEGWWQRKPHFVVGGIDNPYLLRWYIIPRNDWFCVYLHKFLRDDEDRALHDHPWWSFSLLLRGKYIEVRPGDKRTEYKAGSIIVREAGYPHRIELPQRKPCWTLFITGPRVREWGFWCEGIRWVHWKEFTSPLDSGEVGRGCGEG